MSLPGFWSLECTALDWMSKRGSSLEVQWLGLCASSAGAQVQFQVGEVMHTAHSVGKKDSVSSREEDKQERSGESWSNTFLTPCWRGIRNNVETNTLFWPCWVLDINSTSRKKCQVAIEYVSLYLKGDAWVEEINLAVINKQMGLDKIPWGENDTGEGVSNI